MLLNSLAKSFWRLHDETFPRRDLPRIKIALIDDGIDAMQPELADNIAAGNTFSDSPDYPPYFVSSTGHGTALARVIRRLYSHSSLYVAKVSFQTDGANHVPGVDLVSLEKVSVQLRRQQGDGIWLTYRIRPLAGRRTVKWT